MALAVLLETLASCIEVEGYVGNSDDCNDADSLEKPGQVWYLDSMAMALGWIDKRCQLPEANGICSRFYRL